MMLLLRLTMLASRCSLLLLLFASTPAAAAEADGKGE
jgi:hypothetical protein